MLRSNTKMLATFLMIPRIEVVELLGLAGFDGVIIDMEHGPVGIGDLPTLVSAGHGAGLHSIVRLRSGDSIDISSALDAGVDAVMVPHVSSHSEAKAVVSYARFPPEGERSLNPYVRGMGYHGEDPARLSVVNSMAAVIAMVEGSAGLENLPAILDTDGLDAVFVGPVDLSASLGHPGQPEHPVVVEKMKSILESASLKGVATGVYAPTSQAAERWLDLGVSLVAVSADLSMVHHAFRSMREKVGTPTRRAAQVER
jgi:2-keto-3-deoxy-L-rhamnonate aldolase RhmA